MADTYYSWFLVTELHVWMMGVRGASHVISLFFAARSITSVAEPEQFFVDRNRGSQPLFLTRRRLQKLKAKTKILVIVLLLIMNLVQFR